jgi:hypothetical protein
MNVKVGFILFFFVVAKSALKIYSFLPKLINNKCHVLSNWV